jgi:D-3-phosphoglycerate dehydrogenase
VAGTLYGKSDAPRIVGLDEHIVDLPPSSHMLVVRNDDVPGVIGMIGTILGDAGVNIDNMVVGRSPTGAAAMMAISTGLPVPAEVIAEVRNRPGIVDAKAIELG